jgi:L-threonylcarbamoyladenylate synthase
MSFITHDESLILKKLEEGEVVGIPTETVYGLAADYQNEKAIQKIFKIKNRPTQHPLIMHVLPEWDLSQWVLSIPPQAQDLMKKFWPGPLTLVFRLKANAVTPLITGGQDTVAIRAPSHPLMISLLKSFGKPLVAPSANPFEKLSPTTAQHVQKHFIHENLVILDGGRCEVGIESTIVDMANHIGQVLRPGQLNLSSTNFEPSTIKVPGACTKHYQPHKPCYYFDNIQQLDIPLDDYYVMCFNAYKALKIDYQFPDDFQQICYEFYYQLKIADESRFKNILIERPVGQTLQMIADKIQRAARSL